MQNNYITLSEAAKRSPGRPSSNAIWRWARKGLKSRSGQRVRLKHIRCGGRIYTTPESLEQFFTAVAEADAQYFQERHHPDQPRPRTDKQRQRDIDRAEHELAEAGI